MKKINYLALILFILMMLLSGCAGSSSQTDQPGGNKGSPASEQGNEADALKNAAQDSSGAKTGKVNLLVTKTFGREVVFEKTLGYKENSTILDVLESSLTVETAYGGSFVNSINGVASSNGGASGKRQDWFAYINGICCDVGILDYDLKKAQALWWDYHPWSSGPTISAVVGSYPEPFLNGYRGKVKPTYIVCDDSRLSDSLMQALLLQGVSQVKISKLDQAQLENRPGPTIVVGLWDDLKKSSYLDELNQAYSKNGTGVHFQENGVEMLDWSGKIVRTIIGSAGVVVATGAGLGDDSPLWIVAGTDKVGLRNALNLLGKSPARIKHLYGAVILGNEVVALPLQ